MIKGIYTSSSGLQYLQLKQEVIANNLANILTTGFKKEGVFRKTLMERERILEMNATDFVNLEEVDEVRVDYSQGSFNVTNNPFDFAIDGDGFFAVETLDGIKYTRNGSFILDGDNYIVTTHGYMVLDQNNLPIQVSEGDVFIGDDGSIIINGEIVTILRVTDFPKPYNLLKMGDGLFQDLSNAGFTPNFDTYRIMQGMLEDSNVSAVEEMVKMINTMRDFETNQRAILAQDQTLDRAVNDVGRLRR